MGEHLCDRIAHNRAQNTESAAAVTAPRYRILPNMRSRTCSRLRFYLCCLDGWEWYLTGLVEHDLLEPDWRHLHEDEVYKYIVANLTFVHEVYDERRFDKDKFARMLLDKQHKEIVHRILDFFEDLDHDLRVVCSMTEFANEHDAKFAYDYAQGGYSRTTAYGWHLLKNKYHLHTKCSIISIANFWSKVAEENQNREGGAGWKRRRNRFEAVMRDYYGRLDGQAYDAQVAKVRHLMAVSGEYSTAWRAVLDP